MSDVLMKWIGRIFAVAIAATIFTIDCIADFDVSISILYICTLVAVGVRGSDREVIRTAVVCSLLSFISWYVVHGAAPDIASSLRLGFALIAIGVTAALLVSRKHLAAARRQLEESQSELLNFTDSVPQLLWRYSVDKVDFFNRRYTDLTGHDREEAIAKQNWIEWYHPDDRDAFVGKLQQSLVTGEDLRATFRMLHADGNYRWMSLVGRPVGSKDGSTVRWYGGTSDVHEEVTAHQQLERLQSELEESQAELINFMDSVPQILWRATPEAYVDRYNRRFEDLIGRDLEAAIKAQDWLDDFHPDDREWFMERVRSVFGAGEELRATYRLRHADGSYRWPLSADDWDTQMLFFLSKGFRVIAHDRRGHGRSTQTDTGNDMDTYVADVIELTDKLDLKNAVHIGHSTGGGEAARYAARAKPGRVAKVVLAGAVPPVMVKSDKNPGGSPMAVFDGLRDALAANRAQFFLDLPSGPFYGFNRPDAKVIPGTVQNWWRQGMMGGAKAHYDCIKAFSETDFTEDLKKIEVPTLVMHGEDDQIVPIADAALLSIKLLKKGELKTYKGYPHGMLTIHADVLNPEILAFIKA